MAEGVRGVTVLQEELEKAKERLKDVDENIKRLIGRDPTDPRGGAVGRRVQVAGPVGDYRGGNIRDRMFALSRRSAQDDIGSPAKRRAMGGAFSRLGPQVMSGRGRGGRLGGRIGSRLGRGRDSGEEEELSNKPTVQSSIVATPQDARTRQDMIREQNRDEQGKARNRRMFGLLLGTLQSFRNDAKTKGDKERQRKAIEQKLEEKAKEEHESLKRERQQLFTERRNKQAKLRKLEQKLELAQIHEEWEHQTQCLMNFIRTKAKPHLYYLPKTHTSTTEKRQKDTEKILEEIIVDRRKMLEEEIEELTKKDDLKEDDHENDIENEEEEEEEEEMEQDESVTRKVTSTHVEEDGSGQPMETSILIQIDNKENQKSDKQDDQQTEKHSEEKPEKEEGQERGDDDVGQEPSSADKESKEHSKSRRRRSTASEGDRHHKDRRRSSQDKKEQRRRAHDKDDRRKSTEQKNEEADDVKSKSDERKIEMMEHDKLDNVTSENKERQNEDVSEHDVSIDDSRKVEKTEENTTEDSNDDQRRIVVSQQGEPMDN